MIENLSNTYFYILAGVSYIVILIYAAKNLELFIYINKLDITKKIKTKLLNNTTLSKLEDYIHIYLIRPLRPVLRFLNSRILSPALDQMLYLLFAVSIRINAAEKFAAGAASAGTTESLTYIALISRRVVDAENSVSWSIIMALFILFYFILTNV